MNKLAAGILWSMLFLLFGAEAGAQFEYSTNSDGSSATITSYTGAGGVVAIPTNINGLTVTRIAGDAFSGCTNLLSITVPGSVNDIDIQAFAYCYALTNATIGDGVASLGDYCFEECFGLTNVSIPASVTNIGIVPFDECSALTNISVDASNMFYSAWGGALFDKSRATLIQYPGGVYGDYAVPDGVTTIGTNAAASDALLTGVTFPASVTNIGDFAFGDDNLTNVTISANVTHIGADPFGGYSLIAINVDSNNPAYASLDGVLFDKNQTTLLEFPQDRGGTYSIPNGVVAISDWAFEDSSLTGVTIPETVTSIGLAAFNQSLSLESIIIPDSVTNLGQAAFDKCGNLTNVAIGTGVQSIFSATFGYCQDLQAVTISSSVIDLEDGAFGSCANLSNIYFTGNALLEHSQAFQGIASNATVYYLPGTSGWQSTYDGIPTMMLNPPAQFGSMTVTITSLGGTVEGAQWQVDNGIPQSSGATVLGLSVGSHTLSFTSVDGWKKPSNQTLSISNLLTTTATGVYIPSNTDATGLTLFTNGPGTIRHAAWPKNLVSGKEYTLTAVPEAGYLFVNWMGGLSDSPGNGTFIVLATSPSYKFMMEPGTVLQASFATNIFLTAQGSYRGLFGPDTGRGQTNSGAFQFNVSRSGALSGSLNLGGQTVPFSGKFNPAGAAAVISKPIHGVPSSTITLQLDFDAQTVGGTVSNSFFVAALSGNRDGFSASDAASGFEGQYTWAIPGATNTAVGPFGTSCGTVKVSSSGVVTLTGSLADGTAISQSSALSKDGSWPLYASLYGGNGSLWGWSFFTNQTITTLSSLSWINRTNSSKTAVNRAGFTNNQAALTGDIYLPARMLPSGLTLFLETSNQTIIPTKITLKTNKATGIISGSFVDPSHPKPPVKITAVILQNQTNAEGCFLETNQSGAFLLGQP